LGATGVKAARKYIGEIETRTLYLKMTDFVTFKIGEKAMLVASMSGGFLVTTLMTHFFVAEKSTTRAVYNMCVGHSQAFEVKK